MHGDDRKFSGDCGLLAVTHWLHLPEVVNLLPLLHSTPFALVFIFSLSTKKNIRIKRTSPWSLSPVITYCEGKVKCLKLKLKYRDVFVFILMLVKVVSLLNTHLLGIEPNEQALLLFRNMLDILDQFWRGHEQTGAVLWHIRFSQRAPINTKHHRKLKLCPTHFNQSAKKVNLDQLVF